MAWGGLSDHAGFVTTSLYILYSSWLLEAKLQLDSPDIVTPFDTVAAPPVCQTLLVLYIEDSLIKTV